MEKNVVNDVKKLMLQSAKNGAGDSSVKISGALSMALCCEFLFIECLPSDKKKIILSLTLRHQQGVEVHTGCEAENPDLYGLSRLEISVYLHYELHLYGTEGGDSN